MTRRLLALLDRLEREADAGCRPASMQWILQMRLVYIGMKGCPKPQPLRVGELLRRIAAKKSLVRCQPPIVKRMLRSRQFGVSMPGGGECLIHWRSKVVKEIRSNASHGVWALLDVDFQNCYPSLEWDDIEDAVNRHVPELSCWTRWCHGMPRVSDCILKHG